MYLVFYKIVIYSIIRKKTDTKKQTIEHSSKPTRLKANKYSPDQKHKRKVMKYLEVKHNYYSKVFTCC